MKRAAIWVAISIFGGCSANPPAKSSASHENDIVIDFPGLVDQEPEPRGALPDFDPDSPGWLGVELRKPADQQPGVLVGAVIRGSPAARAGLLAKDRILAINGRAVNEPRKLVAEVRRHHAGQKLSLSVERGHSTRPQGGFPSATPRRRCTHANAVR